MPKILSNSSPLIHLYKIGQLDLLKYLFDEIIVPKAMYKECVIKGKEDAKKIKNSEWIKIAKILVMRVDEGEA